MSLLTNLDGFDWSAPSPVTTAFATALDAMLANQSDQPQLIILGDLLDLQFSNQANAAQSAIGHLGALNAGGRLHKTLIATAGNHDHSLWTDARLGLESDQLVNPDAGVTYAKTTRAFKDPQHGEPAANSRLMTNIAKAAQFADVDFRYPNIGFGDTQRAVFLHHGHFVESPYRLISTLRDFATGEPRPFLTHEEIATENAGWLDFFWSSIGETGLGYGSYDLYQQLLTSAGFRTMSAKWSVAIAEKLSELLPLSGNVTLQQALRMATRVGFDVTLGAFRDNERAAIVETLTTDGWDGLKWYLDGVAQAQIKAELFADTKDPDCAIDDLTFIFGHTHKPFADRVASRTSRAAVKVYNTGGWTLNGPRLDNRTGASMILIDHDLNVVSVRVLQTPQHGKMRRAYVEHLSNPTEGASKFAETVRGWIAASAPLWDDLAAAGQTAYDLRQSLLLNLTDPDAQTQRVAT